MAGCCFFPMVGKQLNRRVRERISQHMKSIRLLINLYPMEAGDRLEEIAACLSLNLANPLISEIVVLDEGFPRQELLQNSKVTVQKIGSRPDFAGYYDRLSPDGLNVLANNDIWFDRTLGRLRWLASGPYDLLCLSRREADGTLCKSKEGDAQDAWIFYGQAAPLKECTFPMGIPGCENRLAFEFFAKRYRVLNPSRVIRAHHEHRSQSRSYEESQRVPGPYLLSRPVGLLQFHFFRTLLKFIQTARILRVKELPKPDADVSCAHE